jgi:3'5'-cyclic nucleotide phosphodiesterase
VCTHLRFSFVLSALLCPTSCITTVHCSLVTGLNNVYQVAAGTKLALRYNDASPLENHHAAMAWALLRRHDSDILTALTPSEKVMLQIPKHTQVQDVEVLSCNAVHLQCDLLQS